jgi:arylsulfatase A-like enzyme
VQFDWCVGQVMKALEKHDVAENTLVIVTSDNGPVIDDGYRDEAVAKLGDHRASGPYRGGKYSNFEGGTRVPFIARWPARIKPGVSQALVCQVDFPATFAALGGRTDPLPKTAAPDSFDLSAALCGESDKGRETLVEQAGVLSLRHGDWKFIPSGQGPKRAANTNTELGNEPAGQLFNLADDPGETKNLAAENADRVKEMAAMLNKIRELVRTRR